MEKSTDTNRRDFIKKTGVLAGGLYGQLCRCKYHS